MMSVSRLFIFCLILSACGPAQKTGTGAGSSTVVTLNANDFTHQQQSMHTHANYDSDKGSVELIRSVALNHGYVVKSAAYKLKAGTYRFSARIKVSAGNSLDPVVQLHAINSGKIVANLNIMGAEAAPAFKDYAVEFDAKEDLFNFAVHSNGRNDVEFEKMTVEKISKKFESSELYQLVKEDEKDKAIKLSKGKLYYYDLRANVEQLKDYSYQEQLMTLIAVLQGLVNRDKPLLYVRFVDDRTGNTREGKQDEFWLNYLSKEKGWLPQGENIVKVKSVGTLLRIFSQYYDGLTVWDVFAPATYNAGLTDCGVNNRLLVKYSDEVNSMYKILTEKLGFKIKLDLYGKFDGKKSTTIWQTNQPSTGSKKNDVYIWAVQEYIKTKKTNPYVLSGYLDGWIGENGITQKVYYNENGGIYVGIGGVPVWKNRFLHTDIMPRDYFIAKKAFFYDLSAVKDDTPIDDLNQELGLDARTFEMILRENNKNAGNTVVESGGFTNWQLKYSNSVKEHATVGEGDLEPAFVKLLTKYNVTMQADAHSLSAMANGSIYTLYPAKQQYNQDKTQKKMLEKAATARLENKNYLLIYMGDYDGASWINRMIPYMFTDPNLGKLPLMWPICAVNEGRVKHAYDYMYENATENDIFVGGNNGYGYNYLDVFLDKNRTGINGTLENYITRTKKAYDKYDLDIMGMYFGSWDAASAEESDFKKMYTQFSRLSPYGVVTSIGRVVKSTTDYYNPETGTVFMAKDPYHPGRHPVVQSGNQNFVIEGQQIHQLSVISQSDDVSKTQRPQFNIIRPVLATPTQIVEGIETLQRKYPDYNFEVVDPYTFFKLYKQYLDNYLAGVYKK
ncbi:MAG: GxGYxYP family putative glycoside hydrolase [Niabella sp.]